MKKLQVAMSALLIFVASPVLAHEVSTGNSNQISDCASAVATVSGSDFRDCETNHNGVDNCFKWAQERKANLESGIGASCERAVRRALGPGGCEEQGKKMRILYHVHTGHECTVERGCTGRDGNPPPHDHWEQVHIHVDCH